MNLICPVCNGIAKSIWCDTYHRHEFVCFKCGAGEIEILDALFQQNQRAFIYWDDYEN